MPTALPSTFTSLLIHSTTPLTSTLQSLPLPTPSSLPASHALIRVHVCASNPKDHLHLTAAFNSGDDFSGTIVAFSSDVTPNTTRFKIGDRVAAFHQMGTPYGAYAEYAAAPLATMFKISDSMSCEEASTMPLVLATAGVTLFRRQGIAAPWESDAKENNKDRVLLVYGASTALSCFSIKLAKLAGVGKIVAVGGANGAYVRSLLGEGDLWMDYRDGIREVIEGLYRLTQGKLNIMHAMDCISNDHSWVGVSEMVKSGGLVSVFNGKHGYDDRMIKDGVRIVYTFVGSVHTGCYKEGMPMQPVRDGKVDVEGVVGDVGFGKRFFEWVEDVVGREELDGHRFEVVEGGLDGVVEGLEMLRQGKAAGRKFVYKVIG